MRALILAALVLAGCGEGAPQTSQQAPPAPEQQRTEAEVKKQFDLALREANGEVFLSLLRPEEAKGVSVEAATAFLKKFPQSWSKEPGLAVTTPGGPRIPYNDSNNKMMIVFTATGPTTYTVMENPERLFDTETLLVNGQRYAAATMAQILFGYAYHRATVARKPGEAKAEVAQRNFESYYKIHGGSGHPAVRRSRDRQAAHVGRDRAG
ncbi:MAG TPA: hypothetical protein VEX38_06130 [Fimbriimonadaceae bacterium]|nr:hypothetical protein [Fimbriimonadaceae bacterium]